MAETKKLPTRAEVPEELTWDLEVIFKSDAEFNQSYQELEEKLTKVDSVKGKIGQSSEDLLKGIDYLLDISNQLETIYVYAHLKNDQDTTNSEYQAMYDRANNLATKSSEAISWFEPEVLEIPEETLAKFFEENKTRHLSSLY